MKKALLVTVASAALAFPAFAWVFGIISCVLAPACGCAGWLVCGGTGLGDGVWV